jgi:Fe-Mn family superoxide dismutase
MDPVSGRLINFWVNEHDVGHPAGFEPLLIMDVFEHAFMSDYGLKRADYIGVFFRNINWSKVSLRMEKAAELLKVA